MNKINFNPELWGSHGWTFLQHIALSYPNSPNKEIKQTYKDFFYSIKNILPCESCAMNYTEHITKIPIDNYLKNRDTLFSWIIKMHNEVNKLQNKKLINENKLKQYYMSQNRPSFYINPKIKMIAVISCSILILYLIKKILKIKIKISYKK
jgi:hypothetical protein